MLLRAALRHTTQRAYSARRCFTSDDLNVSHSRFIAESSPRAKWEEKLGKSVNPTKTEDEYAGISDVRGKLLPTSSHLFKLILPLGTHPRLSGTPEAHRQPPMVFLLHPSQPLSHISRLIASSLAPSTPSISFKSTGHNAQQVMRWSDSTDIGDFVRDASRQAEFTVSIIDSVDDGKARKDDAVETNITVSVPTLADRTRYLRRRLDFVESRLREMEGLKEKCDGEAHAGARRMAVGGFGMLVVYWAAVTRLTFWDLGWDVMEPVTYLSGLSTVILGYLWFLYQGREVSYTSVLARSISSRREALYKIRGLDIEQWIDFVSERKALRTEIARIARDYDADEDVQEPQEAGGKKDEAIQKAVEEETKASLKGTSKSK